MSSLERDGFARISGLLDASSLDRIYSELAKIDFSSVGARNLLSYEWCESLGREIQQRPAVGAFVPEALLPVQCTYFEKSTDQNWLVAIHQDLSVPVAEKIDHPALSGWSEKEGVMYVQAPIELLEQLVAIRINLDDCGTEDGPLRVVPGSRRRGRIDSATAVEIRRTNDEVVCTGARGDALAMRPLLLHASSKSRGKSNRRVLHFLYGLRDLPYGLRWHEAK